MQEHRYPTPDGEASYWTPTEAEVRESVRQSLAHAGLGSVYGTAGPGIVQEQAQRVAQLEEWFHLDGRDKAFHPQAGLFTGLAEKAAAVERGEAQWGPPPLFAPVED